MVSWRTITKNILINHLRGHNRNETVQKAIDSVAKQLEKHDLYLLAFMNLFLNLEDKPGFMPYICRKQYMTSMAMKLNLSVAAGYKHRERVLDLIAMKLAVLGVFDPYFEEYV